MQKEKGIITKTAWRIIQFIFTSFDVCWAGDKLVKLLSAKESENEKSLKWQQICIHPN